MLFESHKAEACEWLSGTEFLFLLHLERWRSYAVTRETWVRKARTVQRGTSVHSWQWKVTPLGFHFDPESWRITWRRICPRGTNWQSIDTKMTDGRPFGKRVGSVCFVTRTAVSFTRSVQGCPMIMIVKITLLVVAGAGGALRHKGIPPALVCGSLGSVSPSPVSGEAGHPASSVDQQEDRGLFQHPPEHRWANLSSPGVSLTFLLAGWLWIPHTSTHKRSLPQWVLDTVHPIRSSDSGLLQLLLAPGPTTPQICSLLLQQLKNFCYSRWDHGGISCTWTHSGEGIPTWESWEQCLSGVPFGPQWLGSLSDRCSCLLTCFWLL